MQSKYTQSGRVYNADTSQYTILETNKVLRNTYALLSLTVFFSAICAAIATVMNIYIPPILVFIGMIGLLYLTKATANSAAGLLSVFAFTGFTGLSLGPMLNYTLQQFSNGGALLATSLGATGVVFLSLSAYAMSTRKHFNYLAGFIMVGMTITVCASIANLFFNIAILELVVSSAVVLLMSGYILYDTSKIIHGGERNYIMATINIYLSIFNMFVHLLHLLSVFAGRRD